MAISLKHPFTSAKSDGTDVTLIQPSNWNAEHALTLATNKLLGRSTAGTGAVEEITCTAIARTILAAADAAAVRAAAGVVTATDTASGIIEIATNAEAVTGTDPNRAVTPASLTARLDDKTVTAAQYQANSPAGRFLTTDQVWAAAAEIYTLSETSPIGVDMSLAFNFSITLTGSRTLGNPTNKKIGQSGVIRIIQDGTGNRTLSLGSEWEDPVADPLVLSTGPGQSDFIFYWVRAVDAVVISGIRKNCV